MGILTTRTVHVPVAPNNSPDTFYGKIVSATWPGGAYVDLAFGGHSQPTEVINVYNYQSGTVDSRVHTPNGLRAIVREWIAVQDEEWPEWFQGYMNNR